MTIYERSEFGWPIFAFMLIVAAVLAIVASATQVWPVWIVAFVIALCAFAFSTLRVRVTSDDVRWAFSFGFPGGRIALDDLASVQAVKVSALNGIGIHLTLRGWLWNVHTGSAVWLRRKRGGAVLLGCDDPDALAAAVEQARSGRV